MREEDKARVLVVDDDAHFRTFVTLMLERDGRYLVVGQARTAEEALHPAREMRPDAVLLDLLLPGMEGMAAVSLMHQAMPGVPVILLSGFPDPHLPEQARAAAAAAFIPKDEWRTIPTVLASVLTGGVAGPASCNA